VSAAHAADPYAYGDGGGWSAPSFSGPAKDWSGLYLGLNGGLGFGDARQSTSGFLGGLTAGANWQTGQAVFGGEADLDYGDIGYANFASSYDQRWLGTIRGRIGLAFNRFMAYGTGGVAWTTAKFETSPGGYASNAHLGWTAGLGLEAALTRSFSVKAEYLYASFGSAGYGSASIAPSTNLLRLGLNYHF
jgi:outer membrane immunogenic protein